MNDRIEIKLTEINEEPVGLDAMNADALESFMEVVSSLRSIAENVVGKENLVFSIRAGSALCSIEAPADQLGTIYQAINAAIEGESSNKEVANGLRRIQEQVKREGIGYEFRYHQSARVIDMRGRLFSANRITLKRRRADYKVKLSALQGTIKQIGGDNPNYHLDCGNGDKRTIECTREEAIQINQFLYKAVHPLILCKEFNLPTKNDEFVHLTMIDEELAHDFLAFVSQYNRNDELVNRLTHIHDFVDDQFQHTSQGHRMLRTLLLGFNDKRFHLSELKTLLVISKPFQEHPLIQEARAALLETYNVKRS